MVSKQPKPKRLSALVDAKDNEQTRGQLVILDALLAAAVRKGDFRSALEIMDKASALLRRVR